MNHRQVEELFHAVVDLPPDARRLYLDQHCPDAEVRREVEQLVAGDAAVHPQPPAEPVSPKTPTTSPDDVGTQPGAKGNDFPDLPGYEIIGKLGQGGMGVVYKARQVELNRVVAIKMILARDCDRELDALLRAEAQVMALFEHPNIVKIHRMGEHNGLRFCELEFCPDGDLAKRLNGSSQPPRAVAALVEKLAQAIHYAHEHGIVHRDLKPNNVLLAEDGTPKVSDFGLAKRIAGMANTAETVAIRGTPSYMAPEQAAEQTRLIGTATDVYALGAVLYECLTGRPPFRAETHQKTLDQVRNAAPVPVRKWRPNVPRDLETICHKCLQKEPGKRYASARDLADDLRRFQNGEPIIARAVGSLERGWKWVTRNPLIAGLAAAFAASLLLGTLFSVWKAKQAEASAHQALQAEREAIRQAAIASLERAQAFCEQGDIARGLLLMTQALRLAEQASDQQLTEVTRWNIGAWKMECHTLERVLLHPDEVAVAAFSPDGGLIATGCADGRLRIWLPDSDTPDREIPAHPDGVLGLAFHPNGRLLVTSGRDSILRAWDLERGPKDPPVWAVPFPSDKLVGPYQVAPVAFSLDGTRVAVGSRAGARVFAAGTGAVLGPSEGVETESIMFLPDGRILTVNKQLMAQVWRGEPPRPEGSPWSTGSRFHSRGYDSRGGVVSPNGTYLATSQLEDPVVRVWNLKTQALVRELAHGAAAMHFSPDGRWLITGAWDGTARVWDPEKGVAIGQPLQHSHRVLTVQFHPTSPRVLSAGADNALRLTRIRVGRLVAERRHLDGLLAVSFSPDSTRLATGTGWREPQLCLWDIASDKVLDARLPPARSIADVVFLPNGRSAFVGINGPGDSDGGPTGFAIYRWLFDEPGPSTLLCKQDDEIWRVAASPDGKLLAVGVSDHFRAPKGMHARLWSDTGQEIGGRLLHQGRVTGLAFSGDGAILLTGSHDGTTCFWSTKTGSPLGSSLPHSEGSRIPATAVALRPDGREFVTGGNDHLIRRWDREKQLRLGAVMDQKAVIYHLAYSPDGRFLLSGSGNGSARLWHVSTSQPIGPPMQHDGEVRAVAYSPGGRWFATGGRDGLARVWSIPAQAVGSPDEILRELKIQTGMTLLADDGGCQVLDGAKWLELRRRP